MVSEWWCPMTRLLMTALAMLCLSASTGAIDVTGHWGVTITTAEGTMSGEASLNQTGDHVTGQIGPSGDATIPI